MRRKQAQPPKPRRPRDLLADRARAVGGWLSSLGDFEQLAGVDISSEDERRRLWDQFRHLYTGPTQVLFDAVMDHCAAIALERLDRGEMCLIGIR